MMRKIVGWIVVIGMFLTPTLVLAEANKEFFAASTEENTISEADLKSLFGQDAVNEYGNSVQLALLTDTEMKETEGALIIKVWIGRAAFGGLVGGASAAWGSYASTGRVNWRAVAGGAVIGAFGGAGSRWLQNRGWW